MAAVVAMIVLRMGLGCHFFYEGVWKITHPEFSAAGYLTMAKGPFAWVFHGMVYDIDGRERLAVEPCVRVHDPVAAWEAEVTNKPADAPKNLRTAWEKLQRDAVTRYERGLTDAVKKELEKKNKEEDKKKEEFGPKHEAQIEAKVAPFRRATELVLFNALGRLDRFAQDREPQILAYFADKNRPLKGAVPEAVKAWFVELAEIERTYLDALATTIAEETGAEKPTLPAAVPRIDKGVKLEEVVRGGVVCDPDGRKMFHVGEFIPGTPYLETLREVKATVEDDYSLSAEEQHGLETAYRDYYDSMRLYLDQNQEDVEAHFGSADRLAERKRIGSNEAAHAKRRAWEEEQGLRAEVNGWLGELDAVQDDYVKTVWEVLNEGPGRSDNEQPVRAVSLPMTRIDLIDFSVTFALTAIGLCLLLGLFTRPAAVGGAVFMLFVVLTQPAWPTIYPPAPAVVGHALLINKDFIEMLALCVVATTAVGRWAGLDYFVETYAAEWCGKLWAKCCKRGG